MTPLSPPGSSGHPPHAPPQRDQIPFRRRTITLPGRGAGRLAALDFGPADRAVDLVFLHANGFNALTYRSMLAPLTATRRVLAIDQRGHGATTLAAASDGRSNWHDFRDDLLALLSLLDLRGVVLSGHSMGGTSCLLAAAEAPERARSLVLLDPVIIPPIARKTVAHAPLIEGARRRRSVFASREAAILAYRGRGAFRTWPDAMLADYVTDGFVDLPDGTVKLACEPIWEASSYASHDHDSWGAFDRSTCPIRILRAEHDSTFRADGREDDLTATGRIVIETLPGTSHFLPMERPELACAALQAALPRAGG